MDFVKIPDLSLEQEFTLKACQDSIQNLSREDLEKMTLILLRQTKVQRNIVSEMIKDKLNP